MFARLLCGYLVGAVLGACLVFVTYPFDSPAIVLCWPIAFSIGWLSSRIASRFEILIAGLSMVTGAAVVIDVSISLHSYLVLYGGPYVIFALLGGLASSIVRMERMENSEDTTRGHFPS